MLWPMTAVTGNTCLIVRKLLEGATVDECMAEFDRLQEETLSN